MTLAAALLLSGCSFINDTLMPTLTGEEPSRQPQRTGEQVSIPPSQAEQNPQPTISAAPLPGAASVPSSQAATAVPSGASAPSPQAAPAVPGGASGTYVGQKVAALRGDLQRLQGNINQHSQDLKQIRQQMAGDASTYYNLVAAISSRLQVGTTAGNPQLVAQRDQAQTALDRLSDDITKINTLASTTASDSSLVGYIRESVRATYALPGAVDEDHRQLDALQTDVGNAMTQIDRLLNEMSADVTRQSTYVSNERRNLSSLSVAINNGDLYGGNTNQALATAASQQTASVGAPATGARKPLVVIRFNRPNVDYEQALYTAVSRALERRPSAMFDVVAVSPSAGGPEQASLSTASSKRNAESVVRSLTGMGLPADRINLSATTSGVAQTNEVQVFVR